MPVPPSQEPADAAIGSTYPAFQLAKALIAGARHGGSRARIRQWQAVLAGLLSDEVTHGSRAPIAGTPAWVTLEVVTGGFATGGLAAGGPLQPHERELLAKLPATVHESGRLALNTYFLTDEGFATLNEWLDNGCYRITVPEEAALLTVAWLARHDRAKEARALVAELAPHFARLRFYPIRYGTRLHASGLIHLKTAGETLADLAQVRPDRFVMAQRAAVDVWAPIHDRVVALFLDTIEDDWPCRRYPDGWRAEATALLEEIRTTAAERGLQGKAARPTGHQAQLRTLLEACATAPHALGGREIGRIRHILQCFLAKRGAPGSPACVQARERARADVSGPLHADIAATLARRLQAYPADTGVENVEPLKENVTAAEATPGVPAATPIPPSLQRKVHRCLSDTPARHVESGAIKSADMLAEVLPQLTATLHSGHFADPALRTLSAETYRVFRRRRSLLLLNLQKQVQFQELPWVAAVEPLRVPTSSTAAVAVHHLTDIGSLALRSFPQALLPNKLLQELRALASDAGRDMPLVEELAADIFADAFSEKFVTAAQVAARLLEGSLYACYFGIDYGEIASLGAEPDTKRLRWHTSASARADAFAAICRRRAAADGNPRSVARNGMVIEQQQILTTQNLAQLWITPGFDHLLAPDLEPMCRRCFYHVCGQLAGRATDRHAQLIRLKNAAYAWRQMIFFLAMMDRSRVDAFLAWAGEHLDKHAGVLPADFPQVLQGLLATVHETPRSGRRAIDPFTGWSASGHPLAER